jgi:catechol 2,3-dioxygenase-like lactoylglutathione lyase family enzyme
MWPAVASGCVFYYRDLDAAVRFYTEQLGLLVVMGRSDERGQQHHNGANGLVNDDDDDDGLYVHLQISSTSFLTLADGSSPRSNHSAGEPKATAMALLTDDLEAWDAHAAQRGLPFRGGKRLRRNAPGSAHDGFIILDPEGYKVSRVHHHRRTVDISC